MIIGANCSSSTARLLLTFLTIQMSGTCELNKWCDDNDGTHPTKGLCPDDPSNVMCCFNPHCLGQWTYSRLRLPSPCVRGWYSIGASLYLRLTAIHLPTQVPYPKLATVHTDLRLESTNQYGVCHFTPDPTCEKEGGHFVP